MKRRVIQCVALPIILAGWAIAWVLVGFAVLVFWSADQIQAWRAKR